MALQKAALTDSGKVVKRRKIYEKSKFISCGSLVARRAARRARLCGHDPKHGNRMPPGRVLYRNDHWAWRNRVRPVLGGTHGKQLQNNKAQKLKQRRALVRQSDGHIHLRRLQIHVHGIHCDGGYSSGWRILSKSASKSGNKALASATAKNTSPMGESIKRSVTLTCDKNGNMWQDDSSRIVLGEAKKAGAALPLLFFSSCRSLLEKYIYDPKIPHNRINLLDILL
jgi:hypothetical protein